MRPKFSCHLTLNNPDTLEEYYSLVEDLENIDVVCELDHVGRVCVLTVDGIPLEKNQNVVAWSRELQTAIVEITFTKSDGSRRVMVASRAPSILEKMPRKGSDQRRSTNTVTVVELVGGSLTNLQWRSFDPTRVISYRTLLPLTERL